MEEYGIDVQRFKIQMKMMPQPSQSNPSHEKLENRRLCGKVRDCKAMHPEV